MELVLILGYKLVLVRRGKLVVQERPWLLGRNEFLGLVRILVLQQFLVLGLEHLCIYAQPQHGMLVVQQLLGLVQR